MVAGEVRLLAQRSAEAAREIKSLIQASVERVDQGSRQVQDAGQTMRQVVEAIERVCGIVAEVGPGHGGVQGLMLRMAGLILSD